MEDQSGRPRPIPADVTKANADELRAVWGPFVGEAGTYEVTGGSVITVRPIVSKNPAVMGPGTSITYSYKLEGDTFTGCGVNDDQKRPDDFTSKEGSKRELIVYARKK